MDRIAKNIKWGIPYQFDNFDKKKLNIQKKNWGYLGHTANFDRHFEE
jgi:hypothetical protein